MFRRSRIRAIRKKRGVKTVDHCKNGTHDGKWMYDSNFLKVGPIPPKFIKGLSRDQAAGVGFRHDGVLYFQYALLDQSYDTAEHGVSVKLGATFTGEARLNIQAINRFFEGYYRRAAARQIKQAARNKAEYNRRHPERAEEKESRKRKRKGSPPPEPEIDEVAAFRKAFDVAAKKEAATRLKNRAQTAAYNAAARARLVEHDRILRKRDKAMSVTRGVQLGVKQW